MGVIARAVGVFLSPILHGFHCAFSVPFELVTASQVILYRADSPDNATGNGKSRSKGSCHMDLSMQICNKITAR